MGDRLPGIGRGRAKLGRHRRSFDKLARACRSQLETEDRSVLDDQLATLRGLADQLDRLEADSEHSAHTFALVSRTYADLRRELTQRLPTGAAGDALADALSTALLNSSQT